MKKKLRLLFASLILVSLALAGSLSGCNPCSPECAQYCQQSGQGACDHMAGPLCICQ